MDRAKDRPIEPWIDRKMDGAKDRPIYLQSMFTLQVNIAKHMQVRHQQHALFRGTLHNGRRQ